MPISDNVRPDRVREESIRKKLDDLQDVVNAMKENINVVHLKAEDVTADLGTFDHIVADFVDVNDTLNANRLITPLVDTQVLKTGPIISHPQVIRDNATYTGQLTRVCRLSDNDLVGSVWISGITQGGLPRFRTFIHFTEKFAWVYYDQQDSGTGARFIEVVGTKKITNPSNANGYDVELFLGLGGATQNLKIVAWGFNVELTPTERLPIMPLDYSTQILHLTGVSPDIELLNDEWLTTVVGKDLINIIRYNHATNSIELGPYPSFIGDSTVPGLQILTKDQIQELIVENIEGRNAGVYTYYVPAEMSDAMAQLNAQPVPSNAEEGDVIHAVIFVPSTGISYTAEATVTNGALVWAIATPFSPAPANGDLFVALNMLDRPIGDGFAQGKVYFSNGEWVEMPESTGGADQKDITLNTDGALTFMRKQEGTNLVLNDVTAANISYDGTQSVFDKIENLSTAFGLVVPEQVLTFSTFGDLVNWTNTNMTEAQINLGHNQFTVTAAGGGSLNIHRNKNVRIVANGTIDTINNFGILELIGCTARVNSDEFAQRTVCRTVTLTDICYFHAGYVELNNCSAVTGSVLQVEKNCVCVILGTGTYDNIFVNEGAKLVLDENSTATINSITGYGTIIKAADFS